MENLQQEQKYTFRKWNPKKEKVAMGEDNSCDTTTTCPKGMICCNIVEKGFKMAFPETIDVIEMDPNLTAEQIFEGMKKENN